LIGEFARILIYASIVKKFLLPVAMPFRALILQIMNATGGFLSKPILIQSGGFLSESPGAGTVISVSSEDIESYRTLYDGGL
jgi:hypothetical protein